jgi:hypothetical protein
MTLKSVSSIRSKALKKGILHVYDHFADENRPCHIHVAPPFPIGRFGMKSATYT